VHVPKAAGTSIMRCLRSKRGNTKRWLARTKHETLSDFFEHVSARRTLKNRLLGERPDGFFTFGFVRNPWDRMSSCYRYLVEHRPRPEIDGAATFKEFLCQMRDGVEWIRGLYSMRPQLDFFSFPGGHMRIDFLGHVEHLEEDVQAVSAAIGCPIVLPHHNRSSNAAHDYRMDYDASMVDIVADCFEEEIFHFGYAFERRRPSKRCSGELRCRRRKTADVPVASECTEPLYLPQPLVARA
jgi:hypothetical protein